MDIVFKRKDGKTEVVNADEKLAWAITYAVIQSEKYADKWVGTVYDWLKDDSGNRTREKKISPSHIHMTIDSPNGDIMIRGSRVVLVHNGKQTHPLNASKLHKVILKSREFGEQNPHTLARFLARKPACKPRLHISRKVRAQMSYLCESRVFGFDDTPQAHE